MDPFTYRKPFKSLHCKSTTNVRYFDSRDASPNDAVLGEEALLAKLPDITSLADDVDGSLSPSLQALPVTEKPPFICIFAEGDPIDKDDPLTISLQTLDLLTAPGIFGHHFVSSYLLSQPHFSHHVEYDAEKVRPVAVHVYLRLPRNSRMINCNMRVRLKDLACVCLLSSRLTQAIKDLQHRCIRQISLLQRYPLHLLNFIVERRGKDFENWVEQLWTHVGVLESQTGLDPWSFQPQNTEDLLTINLHTIKLEEKNFTDLLHKLHAIGVELRLAQTIMSFTAELGPKFKVLVEKIEDLRKVIHAPALKPGHRACIEDQADYNEVVLQNMKLKIIELSDRTTAQINVTYSLIAQKGNEQNIRIAEGSRDIAKLTAEDSRTMKAITVLTLVFLPSTMLASLWDAGIFTIEADQSWRVFVGTTFALTTVVFFIWYLYVSISTRRAVQRRSDEEKDKFSWIRTLPAPKAKLFRARRGPLQE